MKKHKKIIVFNTYFNERKVTKIFHIKTLTVLIRQIYT